MVTVAVVIGALLFIGGILLVLKVVLRAYDRPPPRRLTAEDLMRRREGRGRQDQ